MSCRTKQKGARKMGWLSKRGGRIHTWHKRWFVLTGDLMFYYKTPQDNRPTGTIPLAGNKIIRHPDDPKQQQGFKFEIQSGSAGQVITGNHNTYVISADSAELADEWVAAIRRVMVEPYGGGMFGRSLSETMQVEARLGGQFVPILLHRCVNFLRDHGLTEVGIFRLPGQASRIHTLKETYDCGSQKDFSTTEDIHTVASLLKLYLRELPEPVIPHVYYESFKQATRCFENSPVQCKEQVKRLLIQIPQVNLNVIKYLSRFLHEVQEHSKENKMTSLNLGTIFGPHLLAPQTNDPQLLMESTSVSTDFIRILLTWHEELFPVTADERAPKRLSVLIPGELDSLSAWSSKLMQHSLYQPKPQKHRFRPRQNSAPPNRKKEHKGRFGKVASMVEQFNLRTNSKHITESLSSTNVTISGPIIEDQEISLNGHIPITTAELHSSNEGSSLPDNSLWKNSPLYTPDSSEEDDQEDVFKSLSYGALPNSDTMSSDMIVNSISTELEMLERQLSVAREEASRYKKSARLWKTRYEQEYRARLATEEQVKGLQAMIDDTFQQFALDDSEDEDLFSDEGSGFSLTRPLTGHTHSTPELSNTT
ncbi:rho GTPase-activating protein 24-like isoform X2 [Halichondria panicea]|uniref:rho GTPase-activating protein 24-like isoform X2 n=1 Tax=Halichondria panicea TaxID=6063 RepID=UPI00312B6F48